MDTSAAECPDHHHVSGAFVDHRGIIVGGAARVLHIDYVHLDRRVELTEVVL